MLCTLSRYTKDQDGTKGILLFNKSTFQVANTVVRAKFLLSHILDYAHSLFINFPELKCVSIQLIITIKKRFHNVCILTLPLVT